MFSEMDYWISLDKAREKALGKTVPRKARQPKHRARRKVHIELPISMMEKVKNRTYRCSVCNKQYSDGDRGRGRIYCPECEKEHKRKIWRDSWHRKMQNPVFVAKERLRQRIKNKGRYKNGKTKSA